MKFTQNTQIHCTSKKEWQDCLEKFQSLGIKWCSGAEATNSRMLNMWENCKYTSRYIQVDLIDGPPSLLAGGMERGCIQLTAAQFVNSYEGGVVVHGPKEMIIPFFESLKALGYSEDDTRWNQTYNPTRETSNCTYLWSGCPQEREGARLQWHNHLCNTKPENQFTLPEQWSQAFEAMRACLDSYAPRFNGPWKVGDTITQNELNNPNVTRYSDAIFGWETSKCGVFELDRTIKSIEYVDGRWEMRVSGTSPEIKLDASTVVKGYVPPFKIGYYEAKIDKVSGTIAFGCQPISKSEIETMLKMTQSPINADIKIHGTDITTSMLKAMLVALK
jgi:hypothetical protein